MSATSESSKPETMSNDKQEVDKTMQNATQWQSSPGLSPAEQRSQRRGTYDMVKDTRSSQSCGVDSSVHTQRPRRGNSRSAIGAPLERRGVDFWEDRPRYTRNDTGASQGESDRTTETENKAFR